MKSKTLRRRFPRLWRFCQRLRCRAKRQPVAEEQTGSGLHLLEKIREPEKWEICEDDSVTCATVYEGSFGNLRRSERLKWRFDDTQSDYFGFPNKIITLAEIAEQLRDHADIITVFVDEPLYGKIFQYGNYGDFWVYLGEFAGYA